MAKKEEGSVGVVGIGIMGGAFARNLAAAGWRVIGYDIDPKVCRAAARAGVEIAKDAGEVAAKAPVIITSLPHPGALHDTVAAIVAAKVKPRVVVEASTFTLDDKLKRRACAAQGRPHHARLPDQRHRLAGQGEGHRRLCERRSSGDPEAQAGVRRFLARRARPRRLRQLPAA